MFKERKNKAPYLKHYCRGMTDRQIVKITDRSVTAVIHRDNIPVTFKFDADHLNCRECECPKCDYFYQNNGTCEEGCATCNSRTHVLRCMMFKERAG